MSNNGEYALRGDGRVALVTGGASGLGKATASVFGEAGFRIALVDVDAGRGELAAEELCASGFECRFFTADVADAEQARTAVAEAADAWGRLDFVFNNAGVLGSPSPVEELDPEELDRVLAVDLRGPFHVMGAAIPAMRRNGGGAIVNVGSITGRRGSPVFAPYSAAKAGLVALTRSVARRAGRYNIRINCLCPGSIAGTHLTHRAGGPAPDSKEARERDLRLKQQIPLGRQAQPRDVAHVALFLASPFAAHVHGAVLTVDGGESLGYQ